MYLSGFKRTLVLAIVILGLSTGAAAHAQATASPADKCAAITDVAKCVTPCVWFGTNCYLPPSDPAAKCAAIKDETKCVAPCGWFGASCYLLPGSPSAAPSPASTNGSAKPFSQNPTIPCADGRGNCTPIVNPLSSRGTDVYRQVGAVVQYFLLLIGSVTLLMVVWGGFQWLTSAGNEEKIKKGSQTMLWAVIGVVAVLVSYLLLGTYLDYLTGVK